MVNHRNYSASKACQICRSDPSINRMSLVSAETETHNTNRVEREICLRPLGYGASRGRINFKSVQSRLVTLYTSQFSVFSHKKKNVIHNRFFIISM